MATPKEQVEWSDWATLDEDVRAEVLCILDSCGEMSKMSEEDHPKHGQYTRALFVAKEILRTGTEKRR